MRKGTFNPNCRACGGLRVKRPSGVYRCPPCDVKSVQRRNARLGKQLYNPKWRAARTKYRNQIRPSGLTNDRRYFLRKHYKLEEAVYVEMLARQNNKCAICQTEFVKKPCVDHDHRTKTVRGLLCKHCNLAIGQFKDDSATLRSAADYLDKHRPKELQNDQTPQTNTEEPRQAS